MKRYLIIGAGMQGVAAGYYLATSDECRVFFMDIDIEKAKAASEKVNELVLSDVATYLTEARNIDSNDERTNKLIASYDGVLSAATFKINLELTKLCIENNTHMVDLGGNSEVVTKQLEYGQNNLGDCVIVPDSGLAPGLGNIVAQYIQDKSRADEVEILCGGIPEIGEFNLSDPLKYKLVFSYEGLINEYFEPVRNLKSGKVVIEDGFTNLDSEIVMQFGDKVYELEAFLTSGGTTSAPENIVESPGCFTARNYSYKTLRHRGHRDAFKEMYENGRETEIKELIDNPDWKDIILLRVQGKRSGQVVQDFAMRVTECPETGFSAMSQATAYPAAQTLILAANGLLHYGVMTPDLAFCGEPEMVEELLETVGLPYFEQYRVTSDHMQDMFGP